MFVLEPIQQGEGKNDVQLSQPTNSVAPKTISEDNQLKLALREKMDFKNIDIAKLAGVPYVDLTGRPLLSDKCIRCDDNETETIFHVLGKCHFGELMRNRRHDEVKTKLAGLLEAKGFTCDLEVSCQDQNGTGRRIDIFAYKQGSRKAYMIDPTVCYETNDDLDTEVQAEKDRRYRGCIQDLKWKYRRYDLQEIEVIGLWWGARGTVSKGVLSFFNRFQLDKKELPDMAVKTLKASLRMLHHRIYGSPMVAPR